MRRKWCYGSITDCTFKSCINRASRYRMFGVKLFVNNFIQGVIQLLFVHERNIRLDVEIYVRDIYKP